MQGVFGSGKSTLLVAIVLFLVALFKNAGVQAGAPEGRILISAATNVAVDNILLGLLDEVCVCVCVFVCVFVSTMYHLLMIVLILIFDAKDWQCIFQGFYDFIRIGCLPKIAKPILTRTLKETVSASL